MFLFQHFCECSSFDSVRVAELPPVLEGVAGSACDLWFCCGVFVRIFLWCLGWALGSDSAGSWVSLLLWFWPPGGLAGPVRASLLTFQPVASVPRLYDQLCNPTSFYLWLRFV